ncbi:hypothetical protein [Asticcacaulis sp.]|uniref:hypothetical protein n=1 Tax=Asticcacaulis sp. TaxID=1872648 RepID=UPI003F7BBFD5
MTIATIREFRCEMGCGATHQTESRFDPKGWLTVSFGTFGQAKTEHHLCPTCGPKFRASMQPVQKMHELDHISDAGKMIEPCDHRPGTHYCPNCGPL